MNFPHYLMDRLSAILVQLMGMLALLLFLIAMKTPPQALLLILVCWIAVEGVYLFFSYRKRRAYLQSLFHLTHQLEEKYLLAEVMPRPKKSEDEIFYRILQMTEKSMLENIGQVQRERREYKEYIEQWIHEVKTPITAIKLLCENNPSSLTRDLLTETERISAFTEQALYYARSEQINRDYFIREISPIDVIHQAIADNKYLLRKNHVAVRIEENQQKVYMDEKWLRFILNQLIENAVKYRSSQPKLDFRLTQENNHVVLYVMDNGPGISQEDLPRVFDKGFTGANGRLVHRSTGIGLYLCKKLCEKLGVGLSLTSSHQGTSVAISFPINDFIDKVQGK